LVVDGLAAALSARLGGDVSGLTRLLGGASRESWAFELDGRRLVLRRDPDGAPRVGEMRREADLLRAAALAGVPVPEIVDADDSSIVMQWLDGETLARHILRDEHYAMARSRLVEQAATALVRLHTLVERVDGMPDEPDPLAPWRKTLDHLGQAHPALELGLLRLGARRPDPVIVGVVHGDFRLGNWMVDESGLVGVLDWELAHVGDVAADLGWMCVRSWRFGAALPVAGAGSREELLSAYQGAGGPAMDIETLQWWEAVGTLRWGVICIQQAATHWTGAVRSVELAAIGRRVAEVELDLLELLEPDLVRTVTHEAATESLTSLPSPHDRPAGPELIDAIQEWIGALSLDGRDAFLSRVAIRALDIVRREIELGPELAVRHQRRLGALGVGSDAELVAQIQSGRDEQSVVRAVCESVVDKLLVADPRQLSGRVTSPF
jgi:aminoglycoside phosphotransferase (APT) family kinase protein